MGTAWSGLCFVCSIHCVRACDHRDALLAAGLPYLTKPCCKVCTCGHGLDDMVGRIVSRVPHPPKGILDTTTGAFVPFEEYKLRVAMEAAPVRA